MGRRPPGAVSYPGPAAFPTRGVQAGSAPPGEPLAEGSHSCAAVTKPDCHLGNLKTWGGVGGGVLEIRSAKHNPNNPIPGLQLCLHTCSADIMEDAEQQGFGNTASSPDRTVQFIQGPVELLCLLGLYGATRLVLFHRGHSVVTNTPQSMRPCVAAKDHKNTSKDTRRGTMEGEEDRFLCCSSYAGPEMSAHVFC